MADCNTVLNQILKIVPRHEFETLAKQHHSRTTKGAIKLRLGLNHDGY
jgi:hypothetical protein